MRLDEALENRWFKLQLSLTGADREGPSSKPCSTGEQPGLLTPGLAEEAPFSPSYLTTSCSSPPTPHPSPLRPLTGPTMSDTWETVVPEAAPR